MNQQKWSRIMEHRILHLLHVLTFSIHFCRKFFVKACEFHKRWKRQHPQCQAAGAATRGPLAQCQVAPLRVLWCCLRGNAGRYAGRWAQALRAAPRHWSIISIICKSEMRLTITILYIYGKWFIYRWFTYYKWWFSIAMLVITRG